MPKVPVITVTQNDNNIKLIFNITKDGRVESLLGAVVDFQLINRKTGTKLLRTCTITDETTAECMYTLTKDDLALVGTYETEIQVTYVNETKLTKRNPVVINVMPEVVLES